LEGEGEVENEEKLQTEEETDQGEEPPDDNVNDGNKGKDSSFEDLPVITSVTGGIEENPGVNDETQMETQEGETITQEHMDEEAKDEEEEEEEEEVEVEVQPKASPTRNRGRGARGAGSASTAARGRTPAIKNVTAKVDTNIRGRGSGRGTRPTGGRGSRGYRGAR